MANETDARMLELGFVVVDPAARAASIEEWNRAAAHDAPPDVVRARLRKLLESRAGHFALADGDLLRQPFAAMFDSAIEIMAEQGSCMGDEQIAWLAGRS